MTEQTPYFQFYQIGTQTKMDEGQIVFICADGCEFPVKNNAYKCEIYDKFGVYEIIPKVSSDGFISTFQVKTLVSDNTDGVSTNCYVRGIVNEISKISSTKTAAIGLVVRKKDNTPKINIHLQDIDNLTSGIKKNYTCDFEAVRIRNILKVHKCVYYKNNSQNEEDKIVQQSDEDTVLNDTYFTASQTITTDSTISTTITPVRNDSEGEFPVEIVAVNRHGLLIHIESQNIPNLEKWLTISPQTTGKFKGDRLIITAKFENTNLKNATKCKDCLYNQSRICANPLSPEFGNATSEINGCELFTKV